MGSRERRDREKRELKDKILDAARELFATDGVEATTMRRIAERIEYSPTSIYLHFADKDALLRELCINDFAQLGETFAMLSNEADPLKRLRQLGYAYAEFGLAHRHAYQLMFMTPKHVEPTAEELNIGNPERDAYAFLLQTVQCCIDAGALKPEHTNAALVAQTLWAGVHGVVALHLTVKLYSPEEWMPFKARIETMLDLLIDWVAR